MNGHLGMMRQMKRIHKSMSASSFLTQLVIPASFRETNRVYVRFVSSEKQTRPNRA